MFGETFLTILWFLLAVSLLVAIHEYGHFYVARRLGVKVLRFSVGFGRPLFKRVGRDGTEYTLSAIPLGGYVKMLDEREGEVVESERHRAFNQKPVQQRAAIVAAGPAINLVFAVIAFWLMFLNGVEEIKPLVGEPQGIAAESGLRYGDEIRAVDGETVGTWTHALIALVGKASKQEDAAITVKGGDGLERELTLKMSKLPSDLKESRVLEALGLTAWDIRITPAIGAFSIDSAAAEAGMQKGDVITSVNGVEIRWWDELRSAVQRAASTAPGQSLRLGIDRAGQRSEIEVTPKIQSVGGERAYLLGVQPPEWTPAQMEERRRVVTTFQYGPVAALGQAFSESWRFTAVTVETIWLMATGRASASNVSGPITIAQVAKSSADQGLSKFLQFLALVSLSLGILNLLPIPILDGGHLLYYLIESVKGSPVSDRSQLAGQYIGMVALFSLMVLAFHNDLARIFWS